MKELIVKDDYGIFADSKETVRADSLAVAKMFGKSHDKVVRDIERLSKPDSGLSSEFYIANFGDITYKDNKGRKHKAYAMTRKGFAILVMGYTGAKAMKFKELYIQRFDEMEKTIKSLVEARQDFPLLTDVIRQAHETPKPYHYTNEVDMINRLVLGMSAKQYREAHGIPKGESIRPHLTKEQLKQIDTLQKIDVGLVLVVPEFEKRKKELMKYLEKTRDWELIDKI